MKCASTRYASGVVCLFTDGEGDGELADMLGREAAGGSWEFALVFFSKSGLEPEGIAALMRERAPGVRYAACSTAGEITPRGLAEGQVVVTLFPAGGFRAAARTISAEAKHLEETVQDIAAMRLAFDRQVEGMVGETFALCLMDGMSYKEEAMTAALHWALHDVPLLGGSAGDDMNFAETALLLDGERLEGGGIVILLRSRFPVRIFKTENFVPSQEKLVVTRSDPERRIVHELNAAPAALAYAEVIGTDPTTLTTQSFASHPLVVRVGGQYYCRSIQKVNPDNSLSFFCAIDDGVVLTVAEPTGMARSTLVALDDVRESLGEIDFVLGFDCVLRQIDARNRQITRKISEIYRLNNVIGFNTYGEQFRSMHLNQTFTGVAFGAPGMQREAAQ